MAGTNDFELFAQGVGANVIDQPTYAGAPWVPTGFEAGIAESDQLNKVWRQASVMAYVIAAFIIQEIPTADVLDNGSPGAIVTLLEQAIARAATIKPGRVVTASTTLTILAADGVIGLNRTVAPAAMDANLPADAAQFQEFVVSDMAGNFFADPVRFLPPAGTINGAANWLANEDRQRVVITYWGGNVWTAS